MNDLHSLTDLQLSRIREIAAECVARGEEDRLTFKLSDEDQILLVDLEAENFSISAEAINFSNIDSRDQLAAEHYFYGEPSSNTSGPICIALEIWNQEGWRDRGAAGRYLAIVNQQQDIMQIAAETIDANSTKVFEVLEVVQAALPYIDNPSVQGLISLCDAQYEHTKRDYIQGRFFNIFGDCYQGDLDLFRSIIADVREHLRDSVASLYTMAVLRISESEPEEAIKVINQDVKTKDPVLKANAIWALGRMILLERVPADILSASSDLLITAAADMNEKIRLAAYMSIAEGALIFPPLADVLNDLLVSEDQDLLRILALVIFQRPEEAKSNPNFEHWAMALSALVPGEHNAINNLDFVLAEKLKDERQEFVLSVLEAWILRNAGNMPKTKEITKIFDSTFRDLLNDEAMRSRLITSWLIRDEHQIRKAAEAILSELHLHKVHQIAFSQEIVQDFDKDDLILLIRRMLGLVIHEEHLVSLLFSLLSIYGADESLLPLIEEVITNEVGFDFPALTRDRLKELKIETESSEIQAMCERVIKSIDGYFEALKALSQIKELRPSHDLRIKIQKQQGKTMAAHQKAAEENSIIRQLATHIPLKAGRASFSFQNGEMGEPSNLHSFEHSITLPRRHVLDTVGYELSRLGYRTSTKGQ